MGLRVLKALPPLILLGALAALPFSDLGANSVKVLFLTFVSIAASVGWNILGGFAGQVSFGFAVFYGIGAYTTAVGINGGLSPYSTYPLAGAMAALASLLVGLPSSRAVFRHRHDWRE
jgi:branched-chain amino acid transport system permease protein